MFTSNTTLYYSHAGYIGNTALVDGPTNRKTIRSGIASDGSILELSIAHVATKENPGYTSVRSVVRVSRTRVNATTGIPATTYAQFVLGHNSMSDAAGDPVQLFGALFAFLLTGGDTAPASGEDYAADASNVIKRLTAGEP